MATTPRVGGHTYLAPDPPDHGSSRNSKDSSGKAVPDQKVAKTRRAGTNQVHTHRAKRAETTPARMETNATAMRCVENSALH